MVAGAEHGGQDQDPVDEAEQPLDALEAVPTCKEQARQLDLPAEALAQVLS
jgi:hypothetical protein